MSPADAVSELTADGFRIPRYPSPFAGQRVFVAGHRGLLGSALYRRLEREGCDLFTADRQMYDLRDERATLRLMQVIGPDIVIVAAGTVGGIAANAARPVDFLRDNLLIAASTIHCAFRAGVKRLLYVGSSCIYPRDADQPMREEALLSGPLEETNQWYALAKIAGVKLCQAYRQQWGCDYISVMPCNLYGPRDNFDLATAHVPGALIHRLHLAKISGARSVSIWGSGNARREFMHADDCADACVVALREWHEASPLNIGAGHDLSIMEFARIVGDVVGYDGELKGDPSKPEGPSRKLLDISRLSNLGWAPKIGLRDGLAEAYGWFLTTNAARAAA